MLHSCSTITQLSVPFNRLVHFAVSSHCVSLFSQSALDITAVRHTFTGHQPCFYVDVCVCVSRQCRVVHLWVGRCDCCVCLLIDKSFLSSLVCRVLLCLISIWGNVLIFCLQLVAKDLSAEEFVYLQFASIF